MPTRHDPEGRIAWLALAAAALLGTWIFFDLAPRRATTTEHLSHGRFADVAVFTPAVTPERFVLLLSGGAGWNDAMDRAARLLARQGALVAGIDSRALAANLEADANQCLYPDGDFENLSHFVQAYHRLPTYREPVMVGYDMGASLAYATFAQAPKDTFAGAVSMGFCPVLGLHKSLCKSGALNYAPRADGTVELVPAQRLDNPWTVVQGDDDPLCPVAAVRRFVTQVSNASFRVLPDVGHDVIAHAGWSVPVGAALDELERQSGTTSLPPPPELANLPIVAVPAAAGSPAAGSPAAGSPAAGSPAAGSPAAHSPTTGSPAAGSPAADSFAVLLSGDGGWAGLDQNVAAALTDNGIPVIGLDSLRYFWSARTPEGIARDIERIIDYYTVRLGRSRVLLIGYSQGADVLPFAVNRLSPSVRAQVALTAVMGLSEHALFEFHVASWLTDDNSGPATMPEVERITGIPVLCIYGEGEDDSLCPKLDARRVNVVKLKGGHHFDGNYGALAKAILAAAAASYGTARPAAAVTPGAAVTTGSASTRAPQRTPVLR